MALIKTNEPGLPSLFSDFFTNDNFLGFPSIFNRQMNMPAVNIHETEKSYEIELAAPGVQKDNINVEIDGDMLVISGEQKDEKKEGGEDGRYTRREFSYESFNRSFRLPQDANADAIKADFANGVVHLTLPKIKERANKKRIKL